MIYTVTFNPSLDYVVTVDKFEIGMTNRTSMEQMFPGGKGINVSIVLNNLGIETNALGFIAGFVGDEIKKRLGKMGITTNFVEIPTGNSRINLKIKNINGTEINGMGPEIDKASLKKLEEKLDEIKKGDLVVLAGSIPASMPKSIYKDIMKKYSKKGVEFVVDATRELLTNVLSEHPFLVKPNQHELGEIFGVLINTRLEAIPYAKRLQEMGARNVLVSLGDEGALLLCEDGKTYEYEAPKGNLVNSVGAGDSMVAGFLAGWIKSGDFDYATKLGVAAGSASAFSESLATKEEVEQIYEQME